MHASERVLGQFPLSIATSLAFEGAIGIHPDSPNTGVKLADFGQVWVNVRTLFRNFYNAVEKGLFETFDTQETVEQFIQEMQSIIQVVRDNTGGKSKVVFYLSDYIGLDKRNPVAVLRVDSTDKQIAYSKSLKLIVGQVVAARQTQPQQVPEIKIYRSRGEDNVVGKALILTNFAYDLTWDTFHNPFLLESHTGLIKSRNQFYTKLYNGKELPMIPFREDMLAIFGDSELFRPISSTYRNAIKEVATKYNWNYTTTTARMRQSFDFMHDKFMGAKLKSFLRS